MVDTENLNKEQMKKEIEIGCEWKQKWIQVH
jgi:hypothetical protein